MEELSGEIEVNKREKRNSEREYVDRTSQKYHSKLVLKGFMTVRSVLSLFFFFVLGFFCCFIKGSSFGV
jgi:hypothetical protein